MNINILDKSKIYTPDLVINGRCQHINVEEVEVDFGYPSYELGDYVDNWSYVVKCLNPRCKAWRHVHESDWEDDYDIE